MLPKIPMKTKREAAHSDLLILVRIQVRQPLLNFTIHSDSYAVNSVDVNCITRCCRGSSPIT